MERTAVPEASIQEDDNTHLCEHHIRSNPQFAGTKEEVAPISHPATMER
jgi:hypothetical protein